MSYPTGGALPYSGVGEAIAGASGSLWDWTKRAWSAMGGVIDDIYPPDDPDTAKELGDAWIKAADALDVAISASSGAGGRIRDTWPDANGFDFYTLVREVNKGQYGSGGEGYEELAASMRRIGEFCHKYGEQVARAQNQIKSELIHAAVDFALMFAIPGGPWLFASKMALRLARLVKIASEASRLGNWTAKAGKLVLIPIKEGLDEVVTNGIEQGLNIAQGYQDGFNVKESFTNAVAGAVGAPVSAVVGAPGALLGKGIRKTDVGKNALDNPVGKHITTAVSAASTNAISSPISSYAAENMVNGNWGALDDVSGYQKSIKDNWLTSAAIGPMRANAHLAGAQAHNAVFGDHSVSAPKEVVTTDNPPGGPTPPQAMAPEAATVNAGQGSASAGDAGAVAGTNQVNDSGQAGGSPHSGASGAGSHSGSSGATTGSGRGADAFGGSEGRASTNTSGHSGNTGTTPSSNSPSATASDPASSRNGASSPAHHTSTSTASAQAGPAQSGAAQTGTGQPTSPQGTSAHGASAQTPASSGQPAATAATGQTGAGQSGPGQAGAAQTNPAQTNPAQPGVPGSPSRTPQAKPTEGEPNRSDPATSPDQDGITEPVEAPTEPVPDVPVIPAEVPDDQGPPDDPRGPAESEPALPAPPAESPAAPVAVPVPAAPSTPRASDEDKGTPRNENEETPPERPDDPTAEVDAAWDALPSEVREAILDAGPAVAGKKLESLLKNVLAQLLPPDVATRPLSEQLKVLYVAQVRALLANRLAGAPEVTPLALFTSRVVAAVNAVAAKKPRPRGRAVAEAELRRLGRLGAEFAEAAEAENKNAQLPLTMETHLRKILDHLAVNGVPGLDKIGEGVRVHIKRALGMLAEGNPATREQLNGDQGNLTGIEGELRVALALSELSQEQLAELGLPGLRITGLGVKTSDTDIDVHGVLEDSGVEVRFEVKNVASTSRTSVVKQVEKHRLDAGPGAMIIAVFSNELTSEVEAAIAAGANAVLQWNGFRFTVVARRDPGGPTAPASPNPSGPRGIPPAGHENPLPDENQATQEDPEAIRRAMEAENAGALSHRRRLLMGVLVAVRLLSLPNTVDSAMEVKPPKSGPVELIRKRHEEEADPEATPRPGPPPPDDPDNPPWQGQARFNAATGEVSVDMSAPPPSLPPGRPQGPPTPPSSHAERFYHPENLARHDHPMPPNTVSRKQMLLSLRSESALRSLMAEAGLAWNDLRLLLLEHGLLPADSRPARVRDVARILETQWVRSRIKPALQEAADNAAREFARLAEGIVPADSERARKIVEHVRNGTMTPALRGTFIQQIFTSDVIARQREILGDHFGRFQFRASPSYSLDGQGRVASGSSHYSGWVVPNLTLDLVVDGRPAIAHEYDLNTGTRTPGSDRVHRGNTFTRGLFETETLRPADPAAPPAPRPNPVPGPSREIPASPNEPDAIERAMEASNTPVLSSGRRVLMGILLAVRLLGVPNTVDSLLELKPPKSTPSDVIRPRNTDEQGTKRRRPRGLPPRDPHGRFTTARIDPDTGEITFGDAPGPASMGASRHDEVGGSRWIDARRKVAPGPWDGAVVTGEGVLYAPAGMSIGDDMTTRNAHLRVMIATRPDGTKAYVVTLHGSGNGHPIPGLSLMVDTRLTQEQMRAIEEIFMLSPEQVAEATLASPFYTPGRPVQLNSCHSGSSGWAQRYADALGAEVIAPLARLDVMPDGSLRVHGFPSGKGWALFTPGGTAPVEVPAPGNLPSPSGPESAGTPSSLDAVINPGRDEMAEFLGREDVQDAVRRGNEISGRDPDSRIKIDGVPTQIGDAITKLLPRHPEFVKKLLATPFLLNSLLARPQTLGNVLQYPEAIEIVLESLAELDARGAEAILEEHEAAARPGPIELTESQRQVVEDVQASIPEEDRGVQPGQFGYAPPVGSTPGELLAYQNEFLASLEKAWRSDQNELNELADWLAARAGGIAKYRDKVKSRVRALDKLAKDDGTGSVLTDVVGALVRFDTVADVYRALETLREHLASSDSPIDIVYLEDRFDGPQKSGYRDIQMSVRLSSGNIAEFRLHLKSIDEVARYEHSLYEVRRDFAAVGKEQGRAVSPEEAAMIALILRREQELFGEATNRGMTADDEDGREDDEGKDSD